MAVLHLTIMLFDDFDSNTVHEIKNFIMETFPI